MCHNCFIPDDSQIIHHGSSVRLRLESVVTENYRLHLVPPYAVFFVQRHFFKCICYTASNVLITVNDNLETTLKKATVNYFIDLS
jgi:hypothetical protein